MCSKKENLKINENESILIIRSSFLVFVFFSLIRYVLQQQFPTMGPCLFLLEHHKTRWTMLVDNVGLKICLSGTSNFMITVTFFPWCQLK